MTGRSLAFLPVLLGLAYLASSVDQAIFQAVGLPPLYGQAALMGLGLVGLFVALVTKDRTLGAGGERNTRPVILIMTVYLLLTVVSFLYSPQDEIVVDILVQRVKFALFLMLAIGYLQMPDFRRGFEFVSIGLVALSSLLCLFDFVQPTFSSVPGRGAGFYINPNEAGIAIILLALIASQPLRPTLCLALWSVASVGVLLTFSRGAWLILIICLMGLTLAGKFGGGRARFVFVGFVTMIFGLVFSAYLSGDLYLWVVKSPVADLLDANTLSRLGQRGLDIDDYSTLERQDVLALGIARFVSSPFIGHGVGSTISWEESVGTHNMIVMLGAELGILGVGLYLALFVLLLLRTRGSPRLIALAALVSGLTSHNQFDIIALAIPLAYAASTMRRSPRTAGRYTQPPARQNEVSRRALSAHLAR